MTQLLSRPATLPRPATLSISMLLLFAAGCGTPSATSQAAACRDEATGLFHPCPGVTVCIDPASGKTIACAGPDVSFTKPTDASGDGVSSDAGDAGDIADSTGKDAAPGDAADANAIDAVDAGPCQTGDKKCKDKNTVQTCQSGVWGQNQACGAGQECTDGTCGCPSPCKAINQKQCLTDVAAVQTCLMSADKCLSWGVPIACNPGEVCEGGACKTGGSTTGCTPPCNSNQTCQGNVCVPKSTGGTFTCAQLTTCVDNCSGDATCSDGCLSQGTTAAQGQWAGLSSCRQTFCQAYFDANQTAEAWNCMFSNCYPQQSACTGAGFATCEATSDCVAACATPACTTACAIKASQSGGQSYFSLQTCMLANCSGVTDQELPDCAKVSCQPSFTACFSPIGSGQVLYSCLAIAQCQGKCNGKLLCAKACTALGTAQAQADVNAFLDCREYKCAAACAGSDNACLNCLASYCPSQLDACSQ